MSFHRWLYKDGHPNLLAKALNHGWAWFHSLGFFPNYMVTLEVMGRISGKAIRFPLAMVVVDNQRYLVSMLGNEANWVRNIKAADGKAILHHGKSESVNLHEVAVEQRAPILKAYLQIAPGARPHVEIDKDALLAEFEKVAADYPVFRLERSAM